MNNLYELLKVSKDASPEEIKKAFRERAKQLHPDIAGEKGVEAMRKLLQAYKTLSDRNRRFEYDRAYDRFSNEYRFDYRSFLKENKDDPKSQAKLIFFELLHAEEEAALTIWQEQGGLDFPMEKYLDREDWMDVSFILAEELDKRSRCYEAFVILVKLIREERRLPYFKHFSEEVESLLKELVRLRLREAVTAEIYMDCMEILLDLGFNPQYEGRILRSIAETLIQLGEMDEAARVFKEALKKNPSLPNAVQISRKLHV
jgi:curved DNA-binding protein CbpA